MKTFINFALFMILLLFSSADLIAQAQSSNLSGCIQMNDPTNIRWVTIGGYSNCSSGYYDGVSGLYNLWLNAERKDGVGGNVVMTTKGTSRLTVRYNGNVGIGFTSPTYKLHVNGSIGAKAYHSISDKRFKKNINPLQNSLQVVNQLNGVSYQFITEGWKEYEFTDEDQIGFIAQEVKEILPQLVHQDENGYYSVNYPSMIPILVESIKELDKKTDQIESLEARLEKLEALMQESPENQLLPVKDGSETGFMLKQNHPNPSDNLTSIEYAMPEGSGKAQLIISDISGKQLQQYPLNWNKGFVSVDTGMLTNGTYTYYILANGKVVASQRMSILR